jgi:hypothetical protein
MEELGVGNHKAMWRQILRNMINELLYWEETMWK